MEKSKRSLLIEDNRICQYVGKMILEENGWEVDAVETGKEAIEAITNHCYDLILIDIGLPDIDGRDLAKIIREKINNDSLPMIAITAHEDITLEKGSPLTAVYIKPFTREIYEEIEEKYLMESYNDTETKTVVGAS